ncbi:hypothetical protein AYJ54_36860 [Bradyrhizobium centrolobii]|uniref:YjiS-like domain-containing protein n=1 Tax=Bradyrhizobium centrolobii TaxID=1505087 RepID=A0A176Y7T7_9BRAD|nr:DUF1127 domain-containing protein [Bradyrhizobium centrolobii]OAE96331.1 hypothetical protein AYJ54_36860 [Bradyrhizobium centrolobii]
MTDIVRQSATLAAAFPQFVLAVCSTLTVSLWNGIRKRRAMRRAMIELEALDDRALRDMGLNRSDIANAVRGEIDFR